MTNLGFEAPQGHSYWSIEREALYIRKVLAPRVSPLQAFPCPEVMENIDESWVEFNNGEKAHLEMDLFEDSGASLHEGRSYFDPQDNRFVVGIASQTYRNLIRNQGRARFTFTHELGHVVLHSRTMVRRSLLSSEELHAMNREPPNHPVFKDTEWQANACAAAILMPARGMQSHLRQSGGQITVEELSAIYGVSYSAVGIRLDVLRKHADRFVEEGLMDP